MNTMTLRDFVRSGLLANDRGRRVAFSPLLGRVVNALDGGARELIALTPRRCGKSTSIAQVVGQRLLMVPMSFSLVVSPTADQTSDILEQKLRLPLTSSSNPAIRGVIPSLTFARDRITNSAIGSIVRVVPASEVSAPGRTVDLLVLDECRGIPEEAQEVLRPSAAGGTIIMTGTPGRPGTWWHRAATQPSEGVSVITFADPAEAGNPELDLDFVARERRRLERRGAYGKLLAEREWSAQWTSLAENPFLDPRDIESASVAAEAIEAYDVAKDLVFVGVDLSTRRDLTSIVTVARRGTRLRVLELDVVDPAAHGGNVPLELVEKRLRDVHARLRPKKIVLDAHQGVLLAQRLAASGIRVEAIAITAKVNMAIFECLSELLTESRLRWPKHERLEGELLNLEIRETESAWKVVDGDRRLHRDVSFALALACGEATKGMARRGVTLGTVDEAGGGDLWSVRTDDEGRTFERTIDGNGEVCERELVEDRELAAARAEGRNPVWRKVNPPDRYREMFGF